MSHRLTNDLTCHFSTLGIAPNADQSEVKQAYRDLVCVWHPDRFARNPRLQAIAEEKLKQINMAYEVVTKAFALRASVKKQPKKTSPAGCSVSDTGTGRARYKTRKSRTQSPTTARHVGVQTCFLLLMVTGLVVYWRLWLVEKYDSLNLWHQFLIGPSVLLGLLAAGAYRTCHPRTGCFDFVVVFVSFTILAMVMIAIAAVWIIGLLTSENDSKRRVEF